MKLLLSYMAVASVIVMALFGINPANAAYGYGAQLQQAEIIHQNMLQRQYMQRQPYPSYTPPVVNYTQPIYIPPVVNYNPEPAEVEFDSESCHQYTIRAGWIYQAVRQCPGGHIRPTVATSERYYKCVDLYGTKISEKPFDIGEKRFIKFVNMPKPYGGLKHACSGTVNNPFNEPIGVYVK